MRTAATVPMAARRWEPCVRTIRIRGLDLTPIVNKVATGGLDLLMQVRLAPDTPGAPLVNLPLVATAGTEGLRVSGVTLDNGAPVSTIELRINEPTMEGLPFSGEVGDPTTLYYGLQVTFANLKKTRLEGQFIVVPGAVGSDTAPLSRPASMGSAPTAVQPWSSVDLMIAADEVIAIELDGAAEVGALIAQGAASTAEAKTAASQASAAAASVTPLGTATVASNDASATVYNVTVPAGIGLGTQGRKFQFVVPATSLSGTIRLNVSYSDGTSPATPTRDVFFVNSRPLRQGWLATFSANNGGVRWNFESQLPNDTSLTDAESNASASYTAIATMNGVQIARPVGGNPNELLIPDAPLTDSLRFRALIVADITGQFFIRNSAGTRRAAINRSGGAPYTAGVAKGIIASFEYSGGFGNFVYRNDLDEVVPTLPALKALASAASPDIWSVLASVVNQPYGTVTKGADNKPVFTPRTIHILGRGSSVSTAADNAQGQPGRNGGCPPDHVPSFLLRDGINDKFGPGINAVTWNFSHGGHVASQADSQYREALAAGMPEPPDIIFDCFGMNDLAPASYNSGQVSPTFLQPNGGYYNEIKGKLDFGIKLVIISTTPHENTDKYSYVMPGGVPMIWPYNIAANVAPDQLVPPAAQSVVNRDWTGRGIKRNGSARAAHVNNMLREIVRRFNADPVYRGRVILCDAGWAWFRYGLEEHTMAELYGPQEFVHPISLGHEVSYDRCIREIVDAMQRRQSDKWWFRGNEVE
jgi:hypothetical protein